MPAAAVDLYLSRADECREQSRRAYRERDRERWLMLAAAWQRLAERAETAAFAPTFPAAQRLGILGEAFA